MPDPLARLTDAQRACLRLVLTRHSSKEIALTLGISPHSVDKRIERAIQVLGATSRFDAARRVAQSEGTYERFAHDASDIAADRPDGSPKPSVAPVGSGARTDEILPARDLPPSRNRLTETQRAWVVIALMAAIALVTGALLNISETLTDTFHRHPIDLSR